MFNFIVTKHKIKKQNQFYGILYNIYTIISQLFLYFIVNFDLLHFGTYQ